MNPEKYPNEHDGGALDYQRKKWKHGRMRRFYPDKSCHNTKGSSIQERDHIRKEKQYRAHHENKESARDAKLALRQLRGRIDQEWLDAESGLDPEIDTLIDIVNDTPKYHKNEKHKGVFHSHQENGENISLITQRVFTP